MILLPICIALFTVLFAGFGVLSLLLRQPERISLAEAAPLSWLLGAGFVSLTLALLGTLFSGLVLQGLTTALCLVIGGLGVKSLRQKKWSLSCPVPSGAFEWLLCGFLLVELAAVLSMALKESLGWDGLLVWEIKARYAFFNGGAVPHYYFTDASRTWSTLEYPLFHPMIETWLYLWIGDCDQSWVRVIFPCFHLAAVFALGAGVFRLSGKRWGGLLAAALLLFIPYGYTGQGNLFAGYVDFPLSVFYLAAVIYLLRYLQDGLTSHLALFSVLAGIMPWLKREGAFLWFCVMAIVIVELLIRRKFRALLLVPLPGLLTVLGWKIALAILKAPPVADLFPLTPASVLAHLDRVAPIANEMKQELTNLQNWSVLWFAFPVAIACLSARRNRGQAVRLLVAVAVPLCVFTAVFVVSSWPVYMNHLRLTLPRLMLQVAPVALLSIVLAIAKDAPAREVPAKQSSPPAS